MIGDATNTHDVSNKANKFTSNHQRTLRKNNLVANQQQWRVEKQNCMFFFFLKNMPLLNKNVTMKTVRCNLDVCPELMSRLPDFDPS